MFRPVCNVACAGRCHPNVWLVAASDVDSHRDVSQQIRIGVLCWTDWKFESNWGARCILRTCAVSCASSRPLCDLQVLGLLTEGLVSNHQDLCLCCLGDEYRSRQVVWVKKRICFNVTASPMYADVTATRDRMKVHWKRSTYLLGHIPGRPA